MNATSLINDVVVSYNIDTFDSIMNAVVDGIISEEMLGKLVFKGLALKYYKGLMIDVK